MHIFNTYDSWYEWFHCMIEYKVFSCMSNANPCNWKWHGMKLQRNYMKKRTSDIYYQYQSYVYVTSSESVRNWIRIRFTKLEFGKFWSWIWIIENNWISWNLSLGHAVDNRCFSFSAWRGCAAAVEWLLIWSQAKELDSFNAKSERGTAGSKRRVKESFTV